MSNAVNRTTGGRSIGPPPCRLLCWSARVGSHRCTILSSEIDKKNGRKLETTTSVLDEIAGRTTSLSWISVWQGCNGRYTPAIVTDRLLCFTRNGDAFFEVSRNEMIFAVRRDRRKSLEVHTANFPKSARIILAFRTKIL